MLDVVICRCVGLLIWAFVWMVVVRDILAERSGHWMWLVWRWFDREWWKYIVAGSSGWVNKWCRVRGHPAGVWWYNSGGYSPDTRCKNCWEDIG